MGVTKVRSVSARRAIPKIGWPFSRFSFRLPTLTFTKKRSRWPLLVALLFLLIALPTAFYLNSRTPKVEAAWWNPGWAYRQRIAITNSNGSDLTDFQVSFTLDTAALITNGKLQNDCDDLRITDHLGKELPFWIEENNPGCNNSATKIWTKVPNIPTSGAALYVYYGNISATNNEKGNEVFPFFDGFNSAALNTQIWGNTGTYNFASGAITVTAGAVYSKSTILSTNQNYVYEMRSKWAAGGSQWAGLDIASTQSVLSSNSGASALTFFMTLNGTPTLGAYVSSGVSGYNVTGGTSQFTTTPNTYEVIGYTHTPTTLSFYRNQTLTNSYSDTANFAPYVWLGYFMGAGSGSQDIMDMTVDWVRVRKYAATSPATTLATEESTPGPVAHWKFDEGGGSAIKDSSGNNRTGTLSNATWSTGDCVSENCLQFNGTNGYADTGYDYSMEYNSSTSFSVWIRPSTINTGGKVKTILGKVSYEYILSQLDDTIMFRQWTDSGNDTIAIQTPSILEANQWYQITLVYDGTAHTTNLYVNGTLQASGANLQPSFVNRTETLKIGYGYGWNVSPTPYFSGKIDEVKIFPYALTAAQIKKELNFGSAVTVGFENQGSLGEGLVAYWPMNETTGTTIADYSGNNATVTLTNAQETGTSEAAGTTTLVVDADNATISNYDDAYNGMVMEVTGGAGCGIGSGSSNRIRFITDYVGATKTFTVGSAFPAETDNCTFQVLHQSRGKFGGGVYLDGVNHEGGNDTMELTDIRFDSDDPWSYSVWHRIPAGSTVNWNSFFGGPQSGYGGYWQYHGGGNLMWYQDYYESTVYGINDSVVNFGDELPYDKWFMLTLTYTPTDTLHGTAKIYVDSELVHSRSVTLSARTTYFTVDKLAGAGGRSFEGHMDEARLYNRVLADSEIVNLYRWAPKPKAYYPLDEGTGTTTIDKGGGTSVTASSTTWTAGKYGQALHFNGTSSTVDIPNISHPYAFTKMAWVKIHAADCVNESRCSILAPYFEIVSNGQLQMYSYQLNPNGWHSSTVNPGDNVWTHVAVSYDGVYLRLFVNGKQTKEVAASQLRYFDDTTHLGSLSNIRWFAGDIDEVKVYDYARTTQQIVQDMNAGHPVGGSPVGSQLAYWKLDEANGTTVHDSVSSNVGTIASPIWSNSCKTNSCLQFDATDRSVTGNLASSVANQSFTITGWIFQDSDAPSANSWFSLGGGGTNSWIHLRMYSNGTMRFGFYSNDLDSPSGVFTRNVWHHVAYTYDAASKVRGIWLDGKQVASAVSTSDFLGSAAYTIGKFASEYWKGKVDEVKMYSSALTAEQIAIDMNGGASTNYGTGSNEAASLNDGAGDAPILEYNFDEMTGTTAKDTSGQNGNGTINGATWNATGKSGSALEFDGSSGYVDLYSSSFANAFNTAEGTVHAWVKVRDSSVWSDSTLRRIFLIRTDINNYVSVYKLADNQLSGIYRANGVSESVSFTQTPTDFFLVTITWSKSDDEVRVYFNGKQQGSTQTGLDTWVGSLSTNMCLLGSNSMPSATYVWNGLIDQVRIYDYARTPAQISYDYNRGAPVAQYKFDECQGATVYDTSGNNLHGTWSGSSGTQTSVGTCTTSGSAWGNGASGKYSSSLNFDGSDDMITVPHPTGGQLDFGSTSSFSMAAWVKTSDTTGTYHTILEKGGYSTTSRFTLFTYGDGKARVYIADGTTSRNIQSNSTVNDGQWHHIVGQINREDSTIQIFIDGKLDQTAPLNLSGSVTSTNVLRIGGPGPFSFNGQIDDVQIFNYALSADQIAKVYNQGSSIRFGN